MIEVTPLVVAFTLMVLGLSYMIQTGRWLSLTRRIMAEPESFFPLAIVMTAAGITIGYGYSSFNGTLQIFVTVLGWLLALEGTMILVVPGLIQKSQRLSDRFLRIYLRSGGVILLLLGGLLWRSMHH